MGGVGGPTSVRTEMGLVRTPEEDGNVFLRLTPTSPELDLSAPISCDEYGWRTGRLTDPFGHDWELSREL